MASVKRNLVANFAGSAWQALMGLAFMPLYIRFLGVESYGLVGLFSSLLGLLAVLDLGLSQAMNREMARLSAESGNPRQMADVARTLELVYWAIAIGVVAVIVLMSPFIAHRWLNPEHLSRDTLQYALWIMALLVGLRWPVSIYMGGLNGMQRQVLANSIVSIVATVQGVGAVAVLWLIEPTIQAFFLWQVAVALLQVGVLRFALWRSFPNGYGGHYSKGVLHSIWRFAAGMTGITLAATLLTQMDKVLLSKMLSLTEFGYYTFATAVAATLYKIVGPIFTAYYPRFTALVTKGEHPELVRTYHSASQLMAVAILPATLMLAVFSKEILQIWVRDPDIVAHASSLISLLAIGNALNGLMHIPYALQLAHGWTRLAFYQNVVAVAILAPAIYFATSRWGAVGATAVWIVLNSGYLLISVQVMHRRLLAGEKLRWYVSDTAVPLLAALVIVAVGRVVIGEGLSTVGTLLVLMVLFFLATIGAATSAGAIRGIFKPFLA